MPALNLCRAKLFLFFLFLFLLACHPAIKKEKRPDEASLQPVSNFYPEFRDDMDWESLIEAVKKNQVYLRKLNPETIFHYGEHTVTCREVRESQQEFLRLIRQKPTPGQLQKAILDNFILYRATDHQGNNTVLFTGYFEPLYDASRVPDETFKYPIYRKPRDLITADLSLFEPSLKSQKITGRVQYHRFVPYYSRKEIDAGALSGRGLELAWLKSPVDVAFLHIQGSGRLRLINGKQLSVGYSTSNGHPYQSIGRVMLDRGLLTREEMSMQAIRKYLEQHPDESREILQSNPSYIFFRKLTNGPVGNIGVPLTPGRSIALDSKRFPKGALGFISCVKPTLNTAGEITDWKQFSRFVVNQDTGSAIKGSGRADIFWGSGAYAETAAGHLKHEGELYILIKKPPSKGK
jgi:membrane-bound lytic murein transglycosylase A